MGQSELMDRLEAYGADVKGIDERFLGDRELFERCFEEFMGDPSFADLERSLADASYENAFLAAHTLKGVSGNLGLVPFYDAICTLVESLRAKDYSCVDAENEEVQRQYQRLTALASNE